MRFGYKPVCLTDLLLVKLSSNIAPGWSSVHIWCDSGRSSYRGLYTEVPIQNSAYETRTSIFVFV